MGSLESRGLPTPPNWCYVSSILQAFLHAPKFVDWLKEQHLDCLADHCLSCAFRDLSSTYWSDPFYLRCFRRAHLDLECALKKSPTFKDLDWEWTGQIDGAEFFSSLLNALKAQNPKCGWFNKNISKILLASEMRGMGEGQKNELEKVTTLSVNSEVEEDGKKKESPGKKDGKDGKEDEEGDRDEKQEKHEDEEGKEEEQQQQQQQQDEQEQGEQEDQQQQEKHEEENQTEEEKHEKVSLEQAVKTDDQYIPDPKLDKFPRRQKGPNKSKSSQNTKPKSDSEEQTPSNATENLEPKRAQAGKKRRKKKRKN